MPKKQKKRNATNFQKEFREDNQSLSTYEQTVRDYKNHMRDTLKDKVRFNGTVPALNVHAEMEEWEIKNEMRAVKRMIFEMNSPDEVVDKAFHIVCFNILCCTDEEEYIPNEVGVVKYSLRHGIEKYYHCFIDPDVIPLGYTHASKQLSEDTHKIPISGFEQAEKDYNKISKNILELVNPECDTIAPLFCTEENLKQNRGCVDWLCYRTGNLHMNTIHLYDLTCLLMELQAYVCKASPTRGDALKILSNYAFDYAANTRCGYHEENDNRFCALGCAKRACFMLSDALCSLYNVDCTPNHLPRANHTFEAKIQQPFKPQSSRTFVPPRFPQHYCTSICSTAVNDSKENVHANAHNSFSWMKEFHQSQSDTTSFKKADSSSLSIGKSNRLAEMRQPSTKPLVLNAPLIHPEFSLTGGVSEDIGRGRQPHTK